MRVKRAVVAGNQKALPIVVPYVAWSYLTKLEREPATTSLQVRRRKAMMESVEAWLNDWITLYYANRKPFWVPDYACLINKEQLTAICSGKIIADEEDLFRQIPNWDPSIFGPELQSFLTKLRDAHRESVAPKKRKAVGPAPQKKSTQAALWK